MSQPGSQTNSIIQLTSIRFTRISKALDSPLIACSLLLAVGFILRIVFHFGTLAVIWPDSLNFYQSALTYISSGSFGRRLLFNTPLYPLFLSFFLRGGENFSNGNLILLSQHALGLASVIFFYRAFLMFCSPQKAFCAAMLWNLHSLLLCYEATILSEVLFVFFLSLTFYQFCQSLKSPRFISIFCLGVACGLLTLTRPLALYLPLLLLAVLSFNFKKSRPILQASFALGLPYLLLLTPWMYQNQKAHGFFGVSRGIGINLFLRIYEIDQMPLPEQTKYPRVKELYQQLKSKQPNGKVYFALMRALSLEKKSALKAERLMLGIALEGLREAPALYVYNTLKNSAKFFLKARNSVHFYSTSDGRFILGPRPGFNVHRPAFNANPQKQPGWARSAVAWYCRVLALPMTMFSVLAFFGIFQVTFWKPETCVFHGSMLLLLCYFSLLCCGLNYWEDRYRLVVDPFIIYCALGTVAVWIEWGKQRLNIMG